MASATSGDQKLSSFECAICFEKYKSGVKIPKMINCGHAFCDGCIESMIRDNQLECPNCRKIFPITSHVDQFPTVFDLLSVADEEDNRSKSFKYNCTDCSIGLTLDTAFKCKGDHAGVICLKCYSADHGAHGGIDKLKFLLIENRLKLGDALVRLEEEREKYKRLEVAMSTQRTMLDEWVRSVVSTNESINEIFDEFRSEMDEIDVIKRMIDEDESRSIETLTISGRFESFIGDCNFGNARVDMDSAMVRCKFNVLETTLWAMDDQLMEMKCAASDNYFSTREKAHRLRPYLELLKSKADGDGSAVFCERAALYVWGRDVEGKQGYKERGLGDLKILKHRQTGMSRLRMQCERALKICANHDITPEMKLTLMKNSDRAFTWVCQDFTDGELKMEMFAVRFKEVEHATKFKEAFEAAAGPPTPEGVGVSSEPDNEALTSGRRQSDSAASSSTIRSERGRGGFSNKTRGGRS